MNGKYYENIFLYSSLQFQGNIEGYFSKHAKKLIAYGVNPRLRNKDNFIRLYNNGRLISEKKVRLSENIFLYNFLGYMIHIYILMKYFSRKEKVAVITFNPLTFFAMNLQSIFRNIIFIYWVGDFFPPTSLSLRLFEKLKKFYHGRITYAIYLSDIINKHMNGKVLDTVYKKTVMWGVKPKHIQRSLSSSICSLLFVGLIKPGQGLEYLLLFIKNHKNYKLNIVGNCTNDFYKKYQQKIKEYGIQSRIFFPNKFFTDLELDGLSKECHIGIALYDTSDKSSTFYTDPGKVKAYTEMGLPVVMSNTSAVAPYIKKFNAGEIVEMSEKSLETAFLAIKKNYTFYKKGVEAFNNFFYYEPYYKRKFEFLEQIHD